jgi:hypothetical protein
MLESKMKTVLITLFGIKGIVHFDFIPQGHTVIQSYYMEILKQLHEVVLRRRPEVWPNEWISPPCLLQLMAFSVKCIVFSPVIPLIRLQMTLIVSKNKCLP